VELALHDENHEILTQTAIGIILQTVLSRDDTRRIVALIVGVDISEIASQIVIELC
jgi:hypothetical protein